MKELIEIVIKDLSIVFVSLWLILRCSIIYGLLIWPCWNVVMPLFGLEKISYLGSVCLFILVKILFSSFNIKFDNNDIRRKV